MATESPSSVGENLLDSFLRSFEHFVGRISALTVEVAPKEDELQVLLQSTGESLVGQTARLSAYTREVAARLSAPQRAELDTFLRVQDGTALARRTVEVVERQLKAGVAGNILAWITQNLEELKKVFSQILELIFELLHLPFPKWLDKIFLIIDQLANLLASLLGAIFGISSRQTAQDLSVQEVCYLNELAALESFRAARSRVRSSFKDEA